MTWVAAGVGIGSALFGGQQAKKEKKRQAQLGADQEAFEGDRNARIDLARGQIDSVFDSKRRLGQQTKFAGNLRGYLGSELGRKSTDASRQLKFAMARGGQTGGKVAIDTNKRLGDEFAEAAINNERTVQSELAQLKAQDEQARNALKQMAGSGMSLTEANRRALVAGQNTLATADNVARVRGIGDVFADTAKTYKGINERAELRRGYGFNQRRADLYGGRS
jgi:hypothetical protein